MPRCWSTTSAEGESHGDGLVEIGWYPIKATEDGRKLLHWPEMVYQFHREGFSLPRDAVHLASSETYPNQAFRYGQNAWGIQFHAELTRMMMQRWVVRGPSVSSCRARNPAAIISAAG